MAELPRNAAGKVLKRELRDARRVADARTSSCSTRRSATASRACGACACRPGMALPVGRHARPHRLQGHRRRGQLVHGGARQVLPRGPVGGPRPAARAIRRTPMRGGMRGNACISFGVSPRRAHGPLDAAALNEHGVRSFWIYDVLYGVDNFARLARIAKEYELRGRRHRLLHRSRPCTPTTTWPAKAAEIAAVPEIDGVLFYDTAGVLDIERLRALVPKIVAAASAEAGRDPLEQPDGDVGPHVRRGGQARASTCCTRRAARWPTGPRSRRRRASSATSS